MNLIQSISNYLACKMIKKVSLEQIEDVWNAVIRILPKLSKMFDIKNIQTSEDLIGVYSLAFMFPIGAVFKGLLLIVLSLILGVFTPVIAIVLTFMSLRPIAGGYHFKTYGKCTIISLIQFIASALIAQYTLQHWSFTNIWYLFNFCVVVGLYSIYKYIPRDTPNKPITERPEIKKFKKWSSYFLLIWTILMTIFISLNLKLIIISSCFGLLLELFSVSKLGQIFYIYLDTITTKPNNNQQP